MKSYLLPSNYKGTLPIPVGVKAGSQTPQVNGFNAAGGVRSLSLGIKAVPASTVKVSTEKTQVHFDSMSPESRCGR